ncbi:MAG: hypothetical protein PHQ93_08740 [Sulfurimonas sp.]|uniref:hypothetical protein n=1 Tax=Sulfurimonas sp. TaxID=2022749 RepID=UPI002611522A|nr:hypothetical protein [Sulfurimonas sp.]MDD5401257.1 hypothetical protein [Sulfurimonas sp.]
MKLTQQDMARLFDIDPRTLRNWRKDKPFLYATIMKGLSFDEIVEAQKESYEKVKELQEKYGNSK